MMLAKVRIVAKIPLYSAEAKFMHTADGIARFYLRQTNPVNSKTL
jgi:hypothetical protein